MYTLRQWKSDKSILAAYRVMHTTLAGVTTESAVIKRDLTTTPDSFTSFRVTPDKKHVRHFVLRHPIDLGYCVQRPEGNLL